MDIIRVVRLIEISGPRDLVESQLEKSIHGRKDFYPPNSGKRRITIRCFTLGEVAEILGREIEGDVETTVEPDEPPCPDCGHHSACHDEDGFCAVCKEELDLESPGGLQGAGIPPPCFSYKEEGSET